MYRHFRCLQAIEAEVFENYVLQQAASCPDIVGGAAPPVNHDFFGSQY